MIALLRGRAVPADEESAVVDTGGVGYLVNCHARTIAWLHGASKDEVTVHIHTSVSDDAIRLYGFETLDELRLFRLLITVERIGPKAALAILARAELPVLARALRDGDAALLATVPGVGRKTAERLVLELRDKVEWITGPIAATTAPSEGSEAAVIALAGLGYREAEARDAVAAVRAAGEDGAVSAVVAAALRHLDRAGSGR